MLFFDRFCEYVYFYYNVYFFAYAMLSNCANTLEYVVVTAVASLNYLCSQLKRLGRLYSNGGCRTESADQRRRLHGAGEGNGSGDGCERTTDCHWWDVWTAERNYRTAQVIQSRNAGRRISAATGLLACIAFCVRLFICTACNQWTDELVIAVTAVTSSVCSKSLKTWWMAIETL